MCYSHCILNSLTRNNFQKFSFILNIIQLSISIIIMIINLLIFIICDKHLIIRTGFMSFVNNIFLSFLIMLLLLVIEYYRRSNNLTKDKKQTTFTLICFCVLMTIIKCFSSLITIAKIDRIYILIKDDKILFSQTTLMLGITLVTFGLYITSEIILIIYILFIYNLRIIIFNNDANNNINRNNGNLSYMSTRPDITDNSQEIIINNLNEGNKNNNFYFLSQNIINKFEKECEEKEAPTIIKGII